MSDPLHPSDTDSDAAQPGEPLRPSKARSLWSEWLKPFAILVIGMLSFRSAVADWNHVPSGSMKPTILEGDRIFVNKIAYDLRFPFTRLRLAEWGAPSRGDIVVFLSPADGKRLVKRVVGLPGDLVEMHDHKLVVNGEAADYGPIDAEVVHHLEQAERGHHRFAAETLEGGTSHSIMTDASGASFRRVEIPAGHYFMLGDNRGDSADSRVFGLVDGDRILGQATAVALSVDPSNHYRPRWDRFFSDLP